MALFDVFQISGSAMNAQSLRLNTVASNMANADNVATTPEEAYRARYAVFSTLMNDAVSGQAGAGVNVSEIVESQAEPLVRYEPNHPLANEQGNVYSPNINMVEEMANMISASRSYQNNTEVFNTSKQLLLRTLNMGAN